MGFPLRPHSGILCLQMTVGLGIGEGTSSEGALLRCWTEVAHYWAERRPQFFGPLRKLWDPEDLSRHARVSIQDCIVGIGVSGRWKASDARLGIPLPSEP